MMMKILCTFAILLSQHVARGEESKIVGGFTVYLKNVPFATSLQFRGSHFCGGSLVTLSHVLTGCHCLTTIVAGTRHEDVQMRATNGLTAVVGAENIYQTESSEYHQQRNIKEIQIHPLCSFVRVMVFDFAVGYLESPLKESVKVKPFKMFALSKDEYEGKTESLVNSDKTYCYVAGWGSADPLVHKANPFIKAARMKLISDEECQKRLGRQNSKFLHHNFKAGAAMCSLTFNQRKNESDCVGDSGGPYFCGPTVYGIVSFGFDCGYWDVPNVYAKVSHAVDWMMSLKIFPPKNSTERGQRKVKNQTNMQRPTTRVIKLAAAFFLLNI